MEKFSLAEREQKMGEKKRYFERKNSKKEKGKTKEGAWSEYRPYWMGFFVLYENKGLG